MRIGILGGTFDPVHFGHLRPAVEVREALGLDQVRLMPCRVSPLRDEPCAAPGDRLALLQAAAAGMEDLIVDDRELGRSGPSYTADTLAELRAEWPSARLFWLLGSDAFAAFDRWHRWRDILDLAHVVVSRRPESEVHMPEPLVPFVANQQSALEQEPHGRVWFQTVTRLAISATMIRQRAAEGADLRYLMPERCRAIVMERDLYRAPAQSRKPEQE